VKSGRGTKSERGTETLRSLKDKGFPIPTPHALEGVRVRLASVVQREKLAKGQHEMNSTPRVGWGERGLTNSVLLTAEARIVYKLSDRGILQHVIRPAGENRGSNNLVRLYRSDGKTPPAKGEGGCRPGTKNSISLLACGSDLTLVSSIGKRRKAFADLRGNGNTAGFAEKFGRDSKKRSFTPKDTRP